MFFLSFCCYNRVAGKKSYLDLLASVSGSDSDSGFRSREERLGKNSPGAKQRSWSQDWNWWQVKFAWKALGKSGVAWKAVGFYCILVSRMSTNCITNRAAARHKSRKLMHTCQIAGECCNGNSHFSAGLEDQGNRGPPPC